HHLGTVHDEDAVRVADPCGDKNDNAAGDCGKRAAQEELGNCCFGHVSFPFLSRGQATRVSVWAPSRTVTATLPRACPPPTRPSASATSLNEYARSMTGITFPASIMSLRTIRSFWFCETRNG